MVSMADAMGETTDAATYRAAAIDLKHKYETQYWNGTDGTLLAPSDSPPFFCCFRCIQAITVPRAAQQSTQRRRMLGFPLPQVSRYTALIDV